MLIFTIPSRADHYINFITLYLTTFDSVLAYEFLLWLCDFLQIICSALASWLVSMWARLQCSWSQCWKTRWWLQILDLVRCLYSAIRRRKSGNDVANNWNVEWLRICISLIISILLWYSVLVIHYVGLHLHVCMYIECITVIKPADVWLYGIICHVDAKNVLDFDPLTF